MPVSNKPQSIAPGDFLETLKTMKLGDTVSEPLMAAIPADVKWKCIEATRGVGGKAGNDIVTLAGSFCGIPFYIAEIRTEGEKATLKMREPK